MVKRASRTLYLQKRSRGRPRGRKKKRGRRRKKKTKASSKGGRRKRGRKKSFGGGWAAAIQAGARLVPIIVRYGTRIGTMAARHAPRVGSSLARVGTTMGKQAIRTAPDAGIGVLQSAADEAKRKTKKEEEKESIMDTIIQHRPSFLAVRTFVDLIKYEIENYLREVPRRYPTLPPRHDDSVKKMQRVKKTHAKRALRRVRPKIIKPVRRLRKPIQN